MPRVDNRTIAQWRKCAASTKLSGNQRINFCDLLARADGIYLTGYPNGTYECPPAPAFARKTLGRLLRKLLRESERKGRFRTVARCVDRLSVMRGVEGIKGVYSPKTVLSVEPTDLATIDGLRAAIAKLKEEKNANGITAS